MTQARNLHRTQVLLEEWQFQVLQLRAKRMGTSVAALIRAMVDKGLEPTPTKVGVDAIRGLFSDPGFSGRDHDSELYG